MERKELGHKNKDIAEKIKDIEDSILNLLKNYHNRKWEEIKEEYKKVKEDDNKISSELERNLRLNRKKLRMDLIKKIAEDIKNKRKKLEDYVQEYISLEEHKKTTLPIFIDDFDINNLQSANYDLRVGKRVYTTEKEYPIELSTKTHGTMIKIEPGSFGLFLTYEYIFLPQDIYGLISLRFRYKIRGLVNVSGFHIDPGYHGQILFGVYNSGPSEIILEYKRPTFMITFLEIAEGGVKEIYKGESFEEIPPKYIEQLRGPPVSLKEVHDRLEKLETHFKYIVSMLIAIIAGIIVALVT